METTKKHCKLQQIIELNCPYVMKIDYVGLTVLMIGLTISKERNNMSIELIQRVKQYLNVGYVNVGYCSLNVHTVS